MAKQKSRKHHSKPHGGAVSFTQRLAQQRAAQQRARDEAAEFLANQQTQRAMWLMVCSVADAFGIGPTRMQRDFFPAMQTNMDELRRMIEEDGEVYGFEKLRQRAEQVSGIDIHHFYDPDPVAALKWEEKNHGTDC